MIGHRSKSQQLLIASAIVGTLAWHSAAMAQDAPPPARLARHGRRRGDLQRHHRHRDPHHPEAGECSGVDHRGHRQGARDRRRHQVPGSRVGCAGRADLPFGHLHPAGDPRHLDQLRRRRPGNQCRGLHRRHLPVRPARHQPGPQQHSGPPDPEGPAGHPLRSMRRQQSSSPPAVRPTSSRPRATSAMPGVTTTRLRTSSSVARSPMASRRASPPAITTPMATSKTSITSRGTSRWTTIPTPSTGAAVSISAGLPIAAAAIRLRSRTGRSGQSWCWSRRTG